MAIAVPLGEAAARGRTQHPDFHDASGIAPLRSGAGAVRASAAGDIEGDFHAEAQVDRPRSFPAHDLCSRRLCGLTIPQMLAAPQRRSRADPGGPSVAVNYSYAAGEALE